MTAVRALLKMELKLSDGALGDGEFGKQKIDEQVDAYNHGNSRKYTVPANQTDYELDLTDIATVGALLYVKTDQAVSVKLNSTGNSGIPINLIEENSPGYFLLTADVTKLYVTTGGTDTTMVLSLMGDRV